ncbi:MAG: toluene monooxygenase [Hyphomicrobium sp.]|uniref:toluene monooxygenase n=1 Tax=Hyphomicrobium sp. TaxID=82 RepID=UPI0039E26A7B
MGSRKRPSEYEVVSYKLHYRNRNPEAPYEQSPNLRMNEWYKKHVFGSPLQHPDWDSFRDPDEVTYRAYCTMQDAQEQYVDGLLNAHDQNGHDKSLSAGWVDKLATMYTPGRYLLSAAQMASAYLVQMAPASTITNCAVFQEADCFRWLSRTAYRTRELANAYPDKGFGANERKIWEDAAEWQGFRELFENVLATFDWGENFVALDIVALRAIDFGFTQVLKDAARSEADTLTALLCDNQLRDGLRSRRWTAALVKQSLEVEANREAIEGWLKKWVPLGDRAIDAYCAGFPNGAATAQSAKAAASGFRKEIGLAA